MKVETLVSWLNNPVLMREARVRMRGWRAPTLITLYVGIMGAVIMAILGISLRYDQGVFAPELGSLIFSFLVGIQMLLLAFSAPGLTAGAISGERERQTLDLLLVTRMSPLQVVLGKLGSAVGFTLLLMVASLPIYSVLFLLGGISLYHLGLTAIVYVVTVLFLGSIGIYFSATFKRTQASVVATYGTAFGFVALATILIFLILGIFYRRPGDVPPAWTSILIYVNPLFGLASAAGGPFDSILNEFRKILTTPAAREAVWWKYCLTAISISAILLWRTTRKIMPLKNK
jgi:ABC-2 type transport system permease protein